ncbi:hypothetical protein [Chitinilyticum piscinae]|uniref:Uncharacterized protein n=1 Tax=Chitinilyticum piscinae TaxID=2866724 RepID=A0A8J7K8F4_9NEIS|nr:hypothetical protein [Chitinilyticum piscinae]MBE9609433.1 hypothetical protein [Chitinilyticum piscinae]
MFAGGILYWLCITVTVLAALFIALNWIMLLAFILRRDKGTFSFAPPFLCGVAGAGASLWVWPEQAVWIAVVFLLLDPSIALTLAWLAIKRWFKRPN